jgi:signal transduction histidine kinase
MTPEDKTTAQPQTALEQAQTRISELESLKQKCQVVESELTQQNKFFHHVLESLTHPFYVLDANNYTIVMANSAARMGNLSAKPTCYALTHRRDTPCDGVEHTCPLQEVKRTRKPVIVEHTHYDKDGNPRDMEVHAYPIFDEQGNVAQMIEYSLDITDRKRLEKEIQEYADKVKSFAYSVSHDLKNPLISINGLTKLLYRQYRDRFDDKGKLFCDQIMQESQHSLDLIEEINTFIRTKENPLTFEILNVKEILAQVRAEFQTTLTNQKVVWSEPETFPPITADRMSLLRVFRNFIDNALKYGGPEMHRLTVGYQESGDFHILSIRDDGIGVAADQVEKIFGAFQRGDSSRGQEGTGLGLAIVQAIAARHGGKAWAEAGPAPGVTFYISLAKQIA